MINTTNTIRKYSSMYPFRRDISIISYAGSRMRIILENMLFSITVILR